MLAVLSRLKNSPLARVFAALLAIACIFMIFTDADDLILWANPLLFAASVGASVTYAKVAWDAITSPEWPTRGEVLGFGIVLTQTASAGFRGISIAYRAFGYHNIANSDVVNLFLFLGMIGAVCHMNAPSVFEGGIPTRHWIKIGRYFFFGALVAAILFYIRFAQLL